MPVTTRLSRPRGTALAALLAIVALGVTACSSGDSSDNGNGSKGDASKTMTVQFVNPLPSFPTWKLIGSCMKKEADKKGVDLTESGPAGSSEDANAMIQQVQQAVANKKDAVITFPSSDGFSQVLKQARAKHVITGTIYGPGGKENGADYNIGPDWNEIGSTLVDAVAKLPGKHQLGLVAAANTGLGKSWLDGVKAAVAKSDNVSIAGEVYTGDDAAKALPQVNALLSAHPGITEIVTHMGTTTPGAVAALKSHGLIGKTSLVAVGHDNGGTEAVESGAANLVLMQDVCSLGRQLLDGVVDVHEGRTPPAVPVRIAVIGKDQIDSYLKKGWV